MQKEMRLSMEIMLLKKITDDPDFREANIKIVNRHDRRKSISKLTDYMLKKLLGYI